MLATFTIYLVGMVFLVVSVAVPLCIFFGLPKLLSSARHRWVLGAACLIFMVAWWLPSPLIYGQQTQFMTHFFGGGLFSGLVWLYIKLVKGWQAAWYGELMALFALVSSLGVANELFEVILWVAGQMPHGIADTSWDLVANTSGALAFYGGYVLGKWSGTGRRA